MIRRWAWQEKSLIDEIKGKVALVTGASRGIGRAIAVALAKKGLNVAVNYVSRTDQATRTAELVADCGVKSLTIKADVSLSSEVSEMIRAIERELGSVSVLVNNAGIVHRESLDKIREEDWDRVMAVNLKSAFLVTQGVLSGMRKAGWGRIINISSVAAQTGGITAPTYVASKAGLWGLTHSYAALLVNEGITANTVSPALIETDMVTKDLNASPDRIPMGRFGRVEEVAEAVVMLVRNGYMTGQTINVNGGWYFS
jgi:3-oxoacyl-[acyl-carrier protein] reductase